ncbi:hypothetical protein LR48_Vigan216s000900 [Vigna angularis]|uniref:Uncharacterized protein n=1 Tax=Phaseolus angularis TaxID=3914 RepID=A0A0L9T629_PHAAN|nr:hypothetical protein LR48_Vigan216s000900 [Vigna angularis]
MDDGLEAMELRVKKEKWLGWLRVRFVVTGEPVPLGRGHEVPMVKVTVCEILTETLGAPVLLLGVSSDGCQEWSWCTNLVEGVQTLWMNDMRCTNLVEGVQTLWMNDVRCTNLVEGVQTLWMNDMRCTNLVEGVQTLWMNDMRCTNLVEGVQTLWMNDVRCTNLVEGVQTLWMNDVRQVENVRCLERFGEDWESHAGTSFPTFLKGDAKNSCEIQKSAPYFFEYGFLPGRGEIGEKDENGNGGKVLMIVVGVKMAVAVPMVKVTVCEILTETLGAPVLLLGVSSDGCQEWSWCW